jgi:hypothetical protein
VKPREVVILHQISIQVDLTRGSTAMDTKYAVYQTGKNFIRIQYNDPNAETYSFAKGYAHLISRVSVDELMVVREPSYHDDSTNCVRRVIYCLEKKRAKAFDMIRDTVHRRVLEMKKEMDTLHKIWLTQSKISKT